MAALFLSPQIKIRTESLIKADYPNSPRVNPRLKNKKGGQSRALLYSCSGKKKKKNQVLCTTENCKPRLTDTHTFTHTHIRTQTHLSSHTETCGIQMSKILTCIIGNNRSAQLKKFLLPFLAMSAEMPRASSSGETTSTPFGSCVQRRLRRAAPTKGALGRTG